MSLRPRDHYRKNADSNAVKKKRFTAGVSPSSVGVLSE